ncbi:MAG: fatty acid desaturase [Pseudomonadota bacterium]
MMHQPLTEADLFKAEQDVASRHMGHFPWFVVAWGLVNFAVWLSLWPLVIIAGLPLWAGFLIACVSISLSYLPSHEAIHNIIARPGEKLHWLNELVGHVSLLPLVLPYRIARLVHIEHHKHCNDPDLDPDHTAAASGPLHAIWRSIENRQPRARGGNNVMRRTMVRIGRPEVLLDGVLHQGAHYTILFVLAWNGFALEAALIWWLPRHVALTYIQYYLSWAPHHPATDTTRYGNTRGFRAMFGNVASMGMQFHLVHHLHPRIPLMRTPAAYREMRPILEARGCDVSEL